MKWCVIIYLLVFAITFISACVGTQHSIDDRKMDGFRVTRIDSSSNKVYVIYAKRNDTIFKIVSFREDSDCVKIKANRYYNFELESLFLRNLNGQDLSPNALPHVEGIDYHGVLITLERDSINDLFYAKNLVGLCLTKK